MSKGSSSPTNIPVKPHERFIPYGNVYQRVTENDALKGKKEKNNSGLPVTLEIDYSTEVEAAYNIGRANDIYGSALQYFVAGQVGISIKKAKDYLGKKKLTKA